MRDRSRASTPRRNLSIALMNPTLPVRWLACLATALVIALFASAQSLLPSHDTTTDGLSCSSFTWSADKQSRYEGIIVPISLNGRTYSFQLDTGADVLITYGKTPHPDWTPHGRTLRISNVRFAGMSIPSVLAYPHPEMSDEDIQGTVGLDILVGHVFVIDFPNRRVCLLNHADVPPSLMKAANWTNAEIRRGHFYIDAEVGDTKLSGLIFDTGSSPLSLDVDLGTWKQLTGRDDAVGTTAPIEEHVWGKILHRIEAPATADLKIGKLSFPHPVVSTTVERPQYYSSAMAGEGVIGNAPFLQDILVLDLGSFPGFGVISPTGRVVHP